MNTTNQHNDTTEGIIVPPGCDNPMLHNCGEPVSTYTPSSYTSFRTSNFSSSLPHAMHGKTGGISIPKDDFPLSKRSMTEYLNLFKNAYLCLDLWIDSNMKLKKCGILTEIGADFIVLNDLKRKNFTVIDLKPVRYINIYCR